MTAATEYGLNRLSDRAGLVPDQRSPLAAVRPTLRSWHRLPGQLLLLTLMFTHRHTARRLGVQLPGLWCRATPIIQPPHLDLNAPVITGNTHPIAHAHLTRRPHPGAIDLDPATAHSFGRQGPVAEKPRRPQPFVDSQGIHAGKISYQASPTRRDGSHPPGWRMIGSGPCCLTGEMWIMP